MEAVNVPAIRANSHETGMHLLFGCVPVSAGRNLGNAYLPRQASGDDLPMNGTQQNEKEQNRAMDGSTSHKTDTYYRKAKISWLRPITRPSRDTHIMPDRHRASLSGKHPNVKVKRIRNLLVCDQYALDTRIDFILERLLQAIQDRSE